MWNGLDRTRCRTVFLLDYYATGKLDVDVAASVIKGIADGCESRSACGVRGVAKPPKCQERITKATMICGFLRRRGRKSEIIDGTAVKIGDTFIALGSSGAHSNGYSLIGQSAQK